MLTATETTFPLRTADAPVACVTNARLFQDPLLEDPSSASTAEQRRTLATLTRMAEETCLNCPMMQECLYTAVVKHDVAGYTAATTERQRMAMRARLGWRVAPESLDTFIGRSSGHQVDHDEVVRQRRINPTDSLETIAERMNCSVSTIKRHLRMERRSQTTEAKPRLKLLPPSKEQVMTALREVIESRGSIRRSRAA